jgi:co-chaperonin GroES (HSP10)
MTRISPLHNNIVVRDHALGEVTKTGLLIPDIAKASTPYRYGTVVEVGPGRYAGDGHLIPCSPQIGDVIAYAKNSGVEFPLDDDNGDEQVLRLLNEQFVLGIMRDMPVVSQLTGIDGRLLRMNPISRAPSDIADEHLEQIERATRLGIIDSAGDTLNRITSMDQAEAEAD